MKVIIIGGIAAGTSAAAKLKRSNPTAEVIIYEKDNHVSFGACGLPYFVGGFFENETNMLARTPEAFEKSGISIRTMHEVLDINFDTKTLQIRDNNQQSEFTDTYDKLVIATGARSIVPPIKNIQLNNVATLRTMEDGLQLKQLLTNESYQNVVIIGGGFIGLEVMEAAHQYNKNITLFQLEDSILKNIFDSEITHLLEEEIRKHAIQLHLNESVTELIGNDIVAGVKTNNREIPADIVILTTGVKPNTDFITDERLLKIKNGAIIVNEYGETSIPDVYAAGDCATIPHRLLGNTAYIPLATGANKLGRIIGDNLNGAQEKFPGSLGSSCIKVMGMEAGRTGITEKEALDMGLDVKTKFITDKNQTNYYPGQNDMYVKLIYDAQTKVIYGGQVAGYKDAVQRANVLAACIYAKLTTKELGMLDLCYAPPFARTWDILNVAGNVSK